MSRIVAACLIASTCAPALGHDTWVETNTALVRTGEAVWIDLKLGNHGNQHRDFKLANKIDLASATLSVIDPDGQSYDLVPRLIDTGDAPTEGFWTGKFVAAKPGLYTVAHTLDKLHRTTRAVKSAKTCFVVSPTVDDVSIEQPGFDRPLGHPLELVPLRNPVTAAGPGRPIEVQLLFEGRPLADARISFIPRGAVLAEGFDEQFERMSDADGRASFTPTEGNWILVVAKRVEPEQRGEGYDRTSYSTTLTVYVPELCPCCE
jgi:uncharacterized GH25 family protein